MASPRLLTSFREARLPKKILPLVLLVSASLLFWGRAFRPSRSLFYDTLLRYFYPNTEFLRAALRVGDFPLWNPHIYSGVPFLANMQAGLFYPGTFLYVVLPFPTALAADVVLHAILAGIFMFLLGRQIGLSQAGALVIRFHYVRFRGRVRRGLGRFSGSDRPEAPPSQKPVTYRPAMHSHPSPGWNAVR
jgi:hypothetical protein